MNTMTAAIPLMGLLMFTCFKGTDEARILALLPFPGTSHMIANTAIPKELASRGHDVTVITPFPPEKPIPNYRVIPIERYSVNDILDKSLKPSSGKMTPFDMMDLSYVKLVGMLYSFGELICNQSLAQETVQKLINSNEQFDLVMIEAFYTDCFLGFAHKFKTPIVQFCAFGGTEGMGDLVGNPSPYAYVPDPFQVFSDRMSFTERLYNTLGQLYQKFTKKYYIGAQDKIMRHYFNDPNMPSIEELEKLTALVFVNNHFSVSYSRPLVPNFVQVGGMHIKPPKKLPADLQKYLDDAPHGVIYFSMGSNLKSADMPQETVKAFLSTFSKLKQKILWKWEDDSLPGQPPNLKIMKWLPQSDILAHPNVKVFITHGGLLSTLETIDRGVPIVGIPIFGDQQLNMIRAESLGIGKRLEFKNISEESVTWTIREVLDKPQYRENAQRLSRIYRDQPLSPMDQAIFWTEYVIRHKGAPHMRSASLDLCWFQLHLLDVIAVLALTVGLVLLIVFVIIRVVFRKICGSSKRQTQVSAKKKKN